MKPWNSLIGRFKPGSDNVAGYGTHMDSRTRLDLDLAIFSVCAGALFSVITGFPGAFGHSGQGGSLAFADPASRMAFAFVPNQMRFDAEDLRRTGLLGALSECLAGRSG